MEERIFEVGDMVKLNDKIEKFRYGQGSVDFGDIGKIVEVSTDKIFVNFPTIEYWAGLPNELIFVDEIECRDCGEIHKYEEMIKIHDDYGTYYVCKDCATDYYVCDDCGHHCTGDNIREYRGNYYCNSCYRSYAPRLYDYHEFNSWKLFKGKNEEYAPYYIGKEIEIEGGDRDEALEIIYDTINAVGMKDSSLGYGGVECVTHPESWEYLQENKENYRKFFDRIEEIGYGNEGSCGLHFHVTRPNDEVISRIIVLLESFKGEIKKLSRREESQLSEWAKFLSDNCYSSDKKEQMKYQSKKYLKENYINSYHDRYLALNLNNSKTIEFRFFNGANNFEEFWGDLQFIHNLMEIALDEEKDINTVYWKDLMYGEELKSQARRYGVLDIDKKAKETTEIMEKIEKQAEKALKEIQRILKNLARYVNKDMSEITLQELKDKDFSKMNEKYDNFIKRFNYQHDYLNRIINLYNYVKNNDIDIDKVKDYVDTTKRNYPNHTKKYARYQKMIEKAIKDYESEEI